MEQAAPQLEPYARLATVDGTVVPDLAERFKATRYPTLIFLHRERERARHVGAMDLLQLLSWARPLMAGVVGRSRLPS